MFLEPSFFLGKTIHLSDLFFFKVKSPKENKLYQMNYYACMNWIICSLCLEYVSTLGLVVLAFVLLVQVNFCIEM